MKKSPVIYLLLLCCLGFSIHGFSAASSPGRYAAGKVFFVKELNTVVGHPFQNKQSGFFTRHPDTITPSSVFSHFTAENIQVSSIPYPRGEEITMIPAANHLQKDYLLHLFPSHYFW